MSPAEELEQLRVEFREKERDFEEAVTEEADMSKSLIEARECARRARVELDEVRALLWERFTLFLAEEPKT